MEKFKNLSQSREKEPTFKTPYPEVALAEFSREIPEKKALLEVVLKEIDAQGMDHLGVFSSKKFPGISFSFTKLSVTPDVIRTFRTRSSIGEQASEKSEDAEDPTESVGNEVELNSKRHDYFLFAAFAPPLDGHAFGVQDVGIDRFIRLMPRVANAMRQGVEPPEANVYLLGTPTGLGGSVTPEWVQGIKERGFEEYGELYAEFVAQHEDVDPAEKEPPHIVLQGVSKGAVVAEKVSKYLPAELQEHTQRLLDNPAGDHGEHPMRWLKGAEVAAGFAGETLVRILFDDSMKELMRRGGTLLDQLSEEKALRRDTGSMAGYVLNTLGMSNDVDAQYKLKCETAIAEIQTLVKGSSLDTETVRSFIRRAMYDPLTFSWKRLFEINAKSKAGKTAQFYQKGQSIESPFKAYHFFIYKRYKRWAQILDFVEKTNE